MVSGIAGSNILRKAGGAGHDNAGREEAYSRHAQSVQNSNEKDNVDKDS